MTADQSIRIPVINQPEYTVLLQGLRLNGQLLIFTHCDVRDWTPKVGKRLLSDWKLFTDLFNAPLFALNELDDEKHRKFLKLFGFTFHCECTGQDSKTRNLYVHQKQKEE